MIDSAIVIPVYGHFDYALPAVRSVMPPALHRRPVVIIVDDASPERDAYERLRHDLKPHEENLRYVCFIKNGGLTRSWNTGLSLARSLGAEFTCVTNSDVLFSPDWDRPLQEALRSGYDLVGPVTNAPGTEKTQDVRRYVPHYQPHDDLEALRSVALQLRQTHAHVVHPGALNGFCLYARTATWWAHAYDKEHVFKPRNDTNSRGQVNPTPLMTLQEYELQKRWHLAGLKTGVVPSSYVFHYRSVSRGARHGKGQTFRKSP